MVEKSICGKLFHPNSLSSPSSCSPIHYSSQYLGSVFSTCSSVIKHTSDDGLSGSIQYLLTHVVVGIVIILHFSVDSVSAAVGDGVSSSGFSLGTDSRSRGEEADARGSIVLVGVLSTGVAIVVEDDSGSVMFAWGKKKKWLKASCQLVMNIRFVGEHHVILVRFVTKKSARTVLHKNILNSECEFHKFSK